MEASLTEALGFAAIMLAAGVFSGFVAGLFGIGGGFVVVPVLAAMLGFMGQADGHVMHLAIGTSLATIVFTSLRSVQAHASRGAVDFSILRSWAPFVVIGVFGGLLFAKTMDTNGLKLAFGLGVLLLSGHFLFPQLSRRLPAGTAMPKGWRRGVLGSGLGGFSALLGIGGGTPAILIMTLNGKPIHQAIATAAGFGTIIAIPGAIGAVIIGWGEPGLPAGSVGYVNLIAMTCIVAMSVLTAPIGASLAHRLDQAKLKRVFGIYLFLTSAFMLTRGLAGPEDEDISAAVAASEPAASDQSLEGDRP